MYFVLENHKDFNNRRRGEGSSLDEIMITTRSRVPLSGSITGPVTPHYGKFYTRISVATLVVQ